MTTNSEPPISAARLADELGHLLPPASSVTPEALLLVERARELVRAVVMTDADPHVRARVADELEVLIAELTATPRADALFLVRHEDGRVESLLNAGSGRLNPQAPPVEWIVRPTEPPHGTEPVPTEVHARCTFTEAHAGSPARVYGGVVALVLDEALGVAARAAGASGLTVALNVQLKAGTPFGRPVDIRARFTHRDGRKSHVAGEVSVDGTVTATATALLIQERRA